MTRHVDGIRLTPEGLKILEVAKRMEEASFAMDLALNQATPALGAARFGSPSPRGSARSGWRRGWWPRKSGPFPACWWI